MIVWRASIILGFGPGAHRAVKIHRVFDLILGLIVHRIKKDKDKLKNKLIKTLDKDLALNFAKKKTLPANRFNVFCFLVYVPTIKNFIILSYLNR